MRKRHAFAGLLLLCLVPCLSADTIVLKDGNSYSGQFISDALIPFTDLQGIKYQFPMKDVQSLAFGAAADTVTLRSGKGYSGHFTGVNPVGFQDSEGIKYQFPSSDVDAIIFNSEGAAIPPPPGNAMVIPTGADLPVRTNEIIDSTSAYQGQTYSAAITEDVRDIAGNVAIPAGTPARLLIRNSSNGGAVHSAELMLDLYSVTVGGKEYKVVSSTVAESNRKGFGANGRTAEFLGGGSALGALLGGVFGGGKGAGIGALAGAGGGFVTQAFTRGKEVRVPAESVLRFRLVKTLVLQSAS
jgi:hypothetical protein